MIWVQFIYEGIPGSRCEEVGKEGVKRKAPKMNGLGRLFILSNRKWVLSMVSIQNSSQNCPHKGQGDGYLVNPIWLKVFCSSVNSPEFLCCIYIQAKWVLRLGREPWGIKAERQWQALETEHSQQAQQDSPHRSWNKRRVKGIGNKVPSSLSRLHLGESKRKSVARESGKS